MRDSLNVTSRILTTNTTFLTTNSNTVTKDFLPFLQTLGSLNGAIPGGFGAGFGSTYGGGFNNALSGIGKRAAEEDKRQVSKWRYAIFTRNFIYV